MEDRICEELREFNKIYKEFDDLWHETALHIGLSDSAFDILYSVYCLGDGCLQRDICALSFGRKQTINSAIQKLVKEGLLRMKQGKGREMHIYLTEAGNTFVRQKVGTFGEDREQRLEGDATRRETGADPVDKAVCERLSHKN